MVTRVSVRLLSTCCRAVVQVGAASKAKEAPLVLKALYDADVAEEDIILAWHDKQDAAKVGGWDRHQAGRLGQPCGM